MSEVDRLDLSARVLWICENNPEHAYSVRPQVPSLEPWCLAGCKDAKCRPVTYVPAPAQGAVDPSERQKLVDRVCDTIYSEVANPGYDGRWEVAGLAEVVVQMCEDAPPLTRGAVDPDLRSCADHGTDCGCFDFQRMKAEVERLERISAAASQVVSDLCEVAEEQSSDLAERLWEIAHKIELAGEGS